jgi:hypothetical protein
MAIQKLTHRDLVARAATWLRNTKHCSVVLAELVTSSEVPDAIGWRLGFVSILVECKISRSDFLADKRKMARKHGRGMGQRKYYMVPTGLVLASEVPEGWGLIEVDPRKRCKITVQSPEPHLISIETLRQEVPLLVSALRRYQDCERRFKMPHMLVGVSNARPTEDLLRQHRDEYEEWAKEFLAELGRLEDENDHTDSGL